MSGTGTGTGTKEKGVSAMSGVVWVSEDKIIIVRVEMKKILKRGLRIRCGRS